MGRLFTVWKAVKKTASFIGAIVTALKSICDRIPSVDFLLVIFQAFMENAVDGSIISAK